MSAYRPDSISAEWQLADNGPRQEPSERWEHGLRPCRSLRATPSALGVRTRSLQRAGRCMTRNRGACARVKMLLGVHVLGGLRGTREARVRAHLERCIPCRADYDELAEIIPFLDMITGAEAAQDAPSSAGSPDDASPGPGHPDERVNADNDLNGRHGAEPAERAGRFLPGEVADSSRAAWPPQ